MFKDFIHRLKSLYYTPANANSKTIEEETTMNDLELNALHSDNSTPASADTASTAANASTQAAATAQVSNTVDATSSVSEAATTDTSTSGTDSTAASTDTTAASSDSASTNSDAESADAASIVAESDTSSPLDDFKAKAQAFIAFVEQGIEVLGEEAEAELVALKEKYF